jgi:hypothetical protein
MSPFRRPRAAIAEGLHEHGGAEAIVSWRADPGEDRDEAARSPRVVVAGTGLRAPQVGERAAELVAARLDPRPPGPAARSLGRLGRWAGMAAVAEVPGGLETRPAYGRSPASPVGHPLMILDPMAPYSTGRRDRGFVTKEALWRADPDLWERWGQRPGATRPDFRPKVREIPDNAEFDRLCRP